MFSSLSTLLLVFLVHGAIHVASRAPPADGEALVKRQIEAIKKASPGEAEELFKNRFLHHDHACIPDKGVVDSDEYDDEDDRDLGMKVISGNSTFKVSKSGENEYEVAFSNAIMAQSMLFKLWNRYVEGDILYDVIDEKSANTVCNYVSDSQTELSLDETHKYFDFVMKALFILSTDKIGKTDDKWLSRASENHQIFTNAKKKLLERWTTLVYRKCGFENSKNELIFALENLTWSFWRASAERKGKIIFFPGIHIEIVPFLQSIRVVQYFERHTKGLHEVLRKYPLEYLYEYIEPEEEHDVYDDGIPDIFVEKKSPKKKLKKKSLEKGLT